MNQKSFEPKGTHSKRKHRRGKRSNIQKLIHKCNSRQKRAAHRREFRRVRSCWKALARRPALLSLAQERILAETDTLDMVDTKKVEESVTNTRDAHPPPSPILKIAGQSLRLGVFNVRGMNFISARQQVVYLMKKHKIDILAVLETHVNYTGKEMYEGFSFYFSSSVEDDCRKKTEGELEEYNKKVKKDKISFEAAKAEKMRIQQRSAEKLGCAFVVNTKLGLECDVCAINNKIMCLRIEATPVCINLAATHAPHAGHSMQNKTQHYELLTQYMSKWKNHEINIVLGDFNARLMEQLPEETHVIGKHIYRHPTSTIEDLSEQQQQNRQLFIDFCMTQQMIPMNTWFEKPTPQLATYRNTTTQFFDLTRVDTRLYGQLDYILINDPWKNAIKNVSNIHETLLDSDHALLFADMQVRLAVKGNRKFAKNMAPKFRQPSDAEYQRFNLLVQQKIERLKQNGSWHAVEGFDFFAQILVETGNATLPIISPLQKKHYLSQGTWQKIEEKHSAINDGQWDVAKQLTQEIRKLARLDKEHALVQEFEIINRDGYQWEGLKKARKSFQPRRFKYKDKNGELISEKDFAETAAEYFSEIQWALPHDNNLDPHKEQTPLFVGQSTMIDTPFTIAELDAVLATLKCNKTPGPDGCKAELVKWLCVDNRTYMLELYNDILSSGIFPQCFCLANIAACYKKGDATQMKNYRPIALLQVLYKVLASLVRNRLQQALEPWIQRNQFGFRPKKSTSQAIFIARRLLDIAERQHSNLSLVLLDWEKAFDKINQLKLLQVMRRLKTPPNMLKVITLMYDNPKFRITAAGTSSMYRTQNSGIRQGCPLSPYLFVLLMSALFADIKTKLNTPKQKEPIKGIRFSEILYADDTLIFGTHTHSINKLLHAIQKESEYYNLQLNYDKCINLTMHQHQSSIKFLDGSLVPRKKEAIYLGTLLSDSVDNHREICNRLAAASATCHRLKLFWDKAHTSVRWKIRVFDSILRSKILYGLECIQLTQSDMAKLNAFQMKGLRRILKFPPHIY